MLITQHCKEIIKELNNEKKYQNELFFILSQTGVVTREHGFSEAYKDKKKEIQEWKRDADKSIKEFVNKYEEFLNNRIDFENKRSDENIELMKKEIR